VCASRERVYGSFTVSPVQSSVEAQPLVHSFGSVSFVESFNRSSRLLTSFD
jgi:hypothetical protein